MAAGVMLLWAAAMLAPWSEATRAWISQVLGEPATIALPLIAFLVAARRSDRPERRFWLFCAAAFGCWLVALLGDWVVANALGAAGGEIWEDVWYVGFYLLLFVAGDVLRPSARTAQTAPTASVRLEQAGGLLLLTTAVIYTVIVPLRIRPMIYDSALPSFLMYAFLNLLLVIRFAYLARSAQTSRWRRVQGMLAAGALGFLLFNLLEGLMYAGLIPTVGYGNVLDVVWQLPPVVMMAASRLPRTQAGEAAHGRPDLPPERSLTHSFPGLLVLYTVIPPFIHVTIYGLGDADPGLQRARAACVLAAMTVLGAFALVQQRQLARHDRRLLHEHLRSVERAQATRRWETVGRLAGGIAHEFNNLMTAVLGHTGLLLERFRDDPETAADLQRIRAAGNRAAELTRRLLAFGRRQPLQVEPLDLNEIAAELKRDLLPSLVGDEIRVNTQLASDLPRIRGDRSRIQEAIVELVANACAAMPEGGVVELTTEREPPSSDSERPTVLLRVRDDGQGMDEETLERIFDPFFTTKEVGAGTGLGLSVVRGTLQQNGDEIRVESEPDRGTTVQVRFNDVEEGAP